MHISNRQITSKNVRGSNVDFLTIKITLKKGRGNNMNFSTSNITPIKDVETKFIVSVQNLQEINISQVLVFHITTPVSGRLNKSI